MTDRDYDYEDRLMEQQAWESEKKRLSFNLRFLQQAECPPKIEAHFIRKCSRCEQLAISLKIGAASLAFFRC